MFKQLFSRLVSPQQPPTALSNQNQYRLCQQFLPAIKALGQSSGPADPNTQDNAHMRNEDSMTVYDRACLYLEFGQWDVALPMLEALASRLQQRAPLTGRKLRQLCKDMRVAEAAL